MEGKNWKKKEVEPLFKREFSVLNTSFSPTKHKILSWFPVLEDAFTFYKVGKFQSKICWFFTTKKLHLLQKGKRFKELVTERINLGERTVRIRVNHFCCCCQGSLKRVWKLLKRSHRTGKWISASGPSPFSR